MILFLIFSVLLNLVLVYTTWNLLRKSETAEDFIINTYISARDALSTMRQLDSKGVFESDDETGLIFSSLQDVIEDHAIFTGVDPENVDAVVESE